MVASTFSTLQDNSAHGEDSLLTRDLGNGEFLDVVMDGVTGHGGAEASRELGEALADSGVGSIDEITTTINDVNADFFGVGGGRFLLTTVSVALYREGRLYVAAAGDSPIVLVTPDSHERLCGRLGGFLHVGVARAVGAAAELGQMVQRDVNIEPGVRVVLATDGVTDNMNVDELAEIVRSSATPEEATGRIEEIIAGRLVEGRVPEKLGVRFRYDDRTAIVRFFD
jgi:serine/threonine protein phosphatase PrpC